MPKLKIPKFLHSAYSFFRRRPFELAILLFTLLLVLIGVSFFLREKKSESAKIKAKPKEVRTFRVGEVPRLKLLAQVKKENVITIISQVSGVVQKLYVKEGDYIEYKGQHLAYISTNAAGANASSVSRELASKQYEHNKDTFEVQKDLIAKQKKIAEKVDENSDSLREITKKSLDETRDLIKLNEDILEYLNENIADYEAAGNRDLAYQTKQLKSSYQSAVNQLKSALRSNEYSSADDKPPSEISTLQKEMTLKTLELQEKSLDLSLEVSRLQLQLAQISESLSFPSSFGNGVIQKVHVKKGEFVGAGAPLFTISGCEKNANLIVLTSKEIASRVSLLEPSTIILSGQKLELIPVFVSTEPTDGALYLIKYVIPELYEKTVGEKEHLEIEVPVGVSGSGLAVPFVPLDAIYQSSEGSFVFIAESGRACAAKVELGEIYGQFAAVTGGLPNSSFSIILDRTVIDGELVKEID